MALVRLSEGVAFELLTGAGVALEPLREKVNVRLTEWIDPNRGAVSEADALAAIGIDLQSVKARIESAFGPGALPDPDAIPPFTPKAKESLERAVRHALALRHRFIGTEHVLAGVLDQRDGLACAALGDLGVDPVALQESVIRAAAPAQARVNDAWRAITDLRVAVARLAVDDERVKPILSELGSAHARHIGEEHTAVAELANRTAEGLEAATATAQRALAELGIEA